MSPGCCGFLLPFWEARSHGPLSPVSLLSSASSSHSWKLPQPPGSLPLVTSVHSGHQQCLCKAQSWLGHSPVPSVPAAPLFHSKKSELLSQDTWSSLFLVLRHFLLLPASSVCKVLPSPLLRLENLCSSLEGHPKCAFLRKSSLWVEGTSLRDLEGLHPFQLP